MEAAPLPPSISTSRPATERKTVSDETAQLDERDRADMARLAGGHGPALNELMERHAPKLFNYLVRCLQNEDDAADTAQETFVRVYQNCAKFDARQKFSTWLYAIATNLVKDRYRHRSRHPQVSLDAENEATGENFRESVPEHDPTPSESLQGAERVHTIRKAVAELPEELRTPLILSEYEELSHAEIGEILKCTAKAVETRIYRARQQLRISLAKLLESV
jgi:RNA polymerase sigma-70 factor (ECF subfamily)